MSASDEVAEVLARTSAVLAASLDTRELLQLLADVPVPKLADWSFIDLIGEDGWLERVAVAHADPAAAAIAQSFRRRFAPRPDVPYGVSRAVADARPQLVAEMDENMVEALARDAAHLETLRAVRMKSFVCAPLLVGGNSLGVLTLASTTRSYGLADLELVKELARRAARVLEKAQLYGDTRALVRQLENIQLVTAELSRARDEREVATTTVRRGAEAVGAEACVVWVLENDGHLRLVDGHGVPDLDTGEWQRLPPDSRLPAFRVIAERAPLWVETEEDYRRVAPEIFPAQKAAARLRAFAALPLSIGGRGIGVVVFSFALGHHFSDDERRCLVTLSQQCEQALERARLFAQEASLRAQAQEALARAESANQAKDEFLAMLGHELRNPLAPIVTALQIMRMRNDPRPEKELQVIERQVAHLTRLVDDLLDVSRITRGKIQLRSEQVNLAGVVAKAVEMASPIFEQRHHRLEISVPPSGLELTADPLRLAQVVANLLTNAAKYTEPGGLIGIDAARIGDELVLQVSDNGVGLDPELVPRLFDLFVQGRRALDRGQGGLGLGLAIVHNLVKLHGGSVTARSDGPGHGSTFEIRLPGAPLAELSPAAPSDPALSSSVSTSPLESSSPDPSAAVVQRPRKVLVVDDNGDAAAALADLLRVAGHDVAVAHDGAEALRVVETFAPEIAFLDIGLPVMDGYELCERLRQRSRVRLAALTGYGQDHDRARSQQAGFHAHFVKPVPPDLLLRYLEE